ncbi:PLC-like phosphodiesterase [Marasmius fiardii PR-910]|nr:PLC-like phosphodiesterase [Marasmius fiardii PR-910]
MVLEKASFCFPFCELLFLVILAKPTVCNGRAEFCDRKYSDITFVGSHDSFAFSKNPLKLGRDQTIDITQQLEMGVRMLQAQSHEDDGVLKFCHTNCIIFDGGSVEDYLKTVKTFLDKNPNEVLTLLFTNPEGIDVKDVWKPIFDKTGISDLAFVPPNITAENPFVKASDWPTLGQMIESGKRVVVFMDANADIAKVNFILPEFKMIWETPFSVTDENFPCKVDRIDGPLSADDHMFIINHSLNVNILPGIGDGVIVSDPVRAEETNGIKSITDNVEGCKQFSAGRKPNFILIDFVEKGEAFKAADILNGFP